jgi:hypothetical protein
VHVCKCVYVCADVYVCMCANACMCVCVYSAEKDVCPCLHHMHLTCPRAEPVLFVFDAARRIFCIHKNKITKMKDILTKDNNTPADTIEVVCCVITAGCV